LEEHKADLLIKSAVAPAFIQFGLDFGENKCLPTSQLSQAISNYFDFGRKRPKAMNFKT
jgi:hypothetical protein